MVSPWALCELAVALRLRSGNDFVRALYTFQGRSMLRVWSLLGALFLEIGWGSHFWDLFSALSNSDALLFNFSHQGVIVNKIIKIKRKRFESIVNGKCQFCQLDSFFEPVIAYLGRNNSHINITPLVCKSFGL